MCLLACSPGRLTIISVGVVLAAVVPTRQFDSWSSRSCRQAIQLHHLSWGGAAGQLGSTHHHLSCAGASERVSLVRLIASQSDLEKRRGVGRGEVTGMVMLGRQRKIKAVHGRSRQGKSRQGRYVFPVLLFNFTRPACPMASECLTHAALRHVSCSCFPPSLFALSLPGAGAVVHSRLPLLQRPFSIWCRRCVSVCFTWSHVLVKWLLFLLPPGVLLHERLVAMLGHLLNV